MTNDNVVTGIKQMALYGGISRPFIAAVMSTLAAVSEGVEISFRARPMLSDVADEVVLEAALKPLKPAPAAQRRNKKIDGGKPRHIRMSVASARANIPSSLS